MGGHPVRRSVCALEYWIPAFAGMTAVCAAALSISCRLQNTHCMMVSQVTQPSQIR